MYVFYFSFFDDNLSGYPYAVSSRNRQIPFSNFILKSIQGIPTHIVHHFFHIHACYPRGIDPVLFSVIPFYCLSDAKPHFLQRLPSAPQTLFQKRSVFPRYDLNDILSCHNRSSFEMFYLNICDYFGIMLERIKKIWYCFIERNDNYSIL